jgi:DNA invertase Pin-like site-specific DNA recombinase
MRCAIYARVSTTEQTVENQLLELRQYASARGWTIVSEWTDVGVSGSKDRRPGLDEMIAAAKRRKFDVLLFWKLDRLGRSLRHLILLCDELQAVGVGFVSLGEGLDATTPAGKLQFQIIGAIAEFERSRIQERVMAGLRRARSQGKRLGRRRTTALPDGLPRGLTVRSAALSWGVSKSTAARWIAAGTVPPAVGQTLSEPASVQAR